MTRLISKSLIKDEISLLEEMYPDAHIALNFSSVWELLVVVMLSAQCTDERVNKVSPALFAKFPTVYAFATCKITDLEKLIFSTGFYKNKARNIKATANMVVDKFGGAVPSTMEELLTLSGVARKTANVVLNDGFGENVGIVVDTHVMKLSGRLGWVDRNLVEKKNAIKIEQSLMKKVPREYWGRISHLLIAHGRGVCTARKPRCEDCRFRKECVFLRDVETK